MTYYRLEELFPSELEERINHTPILVIPFGTIEWHSHHLPVGLDGIVAGGIGKETAKAAHAVLAPTSYSAVGGVPYPYTLDHPIDIIEPLYISMFEQYAAMGFKVIVAFTGHFGLAQTLTLKRAALSVMQRSPVTILPVTEYDVTTDSGYRGDHAGIGETSLLWAMREDLVRLDAVGRDDPLDGVLGKDPRGSASKQYGHELIHMIATRLAEMADRLLNHTSALDRRRYIEALKCGVRVLAATQTLREQQVKSQVPSIGTPAWFIYCQSMAQGDYPAAKAAAEEKLLDLSN